MKILGLLAILIAEIALVVTIGAEKLSAAFFVAIVQQAGSLVLLAFCFAFMVLEPMPVSNGLHQPRLGPAMTSFCISGAGISTHRH